MGEAVKKDSLFIGFVHGGNVKTPTMDSISSFKYFNDGKNGRHLDIEEGNKHGLYVHLNRNIVTRGFLETGCEWFLSLDTDIDFMHDLAVPYKLIDTARALSKRFVTALYVGDLLTVQTPLGPRLQQSPIWLNEKPNGMYTNVGQLYHDRSQQIGACGMGCALIHRTVFESFPEMDGRILRWFDTEERKIDGKWEFFGEDIVFCDRWRHWCGGEIYGDTRIPVVHIKEQRLSAETLVADAQKYVEPALRLVL